MLRLQHVVVPMTAQHSAGRFAWSSTERVMCVAGQQIAGTVRERQSDGGKTKKIERQTLQREEADERGKWGIVHLPALEQAGRQLEALPASEDRLPHHAFRVRICVRQGTAVPKMSAHPKGTNEELDAPIQRGRAPRRKNDVIHVPYRAQDSGNYR